MHSFDNKHSQTPQRIMGLVNLEQKKKKLSRGYQDKKTPRRVKKHQ